MLTLVTGASGHIGNLIAHRLLAKGRKLRVLLREHSSLEPLRVDGSLPPEIEVVYGDVNDAASLSRAMHGVRRLFHCAAVFQTRFTQAGEEARMVETNVQGTRRVLEAAAKARVERIVYTSSVAAIGCSRDPRVVLDEGTWNEDPIDAYVASKTESERLAHEMQKQLGLDVVYVLPATVIGPGDYKPQPNNDFILKAMQAAPPVYFANGHSYVDAADVAEGHLQAEEKGESGERYLLGGDNVAIRDLFLRISALTGGRKPFLKVGHTFVSVVGLLVELKAQALGGPPLFTRAKAHKLIDYYGYFDSSKAQRELGYRHRPLDEVLLRCRDWYLGRGWLKPRPAPGPG
jgi:dihydroflavonol-4-reductase